VPFSYAQYAGNGSATTFSVPFPYLLKAHVKVYLGLVIETGAYTALLAEGAGYTWTSGTQISATVAPAAGVQLTVRRETPNGSQVVVWNDGSNLIGNDLNISDLQNLYVVQEWIDYAARSNEVSQQAIAQALAAVATANAALPRAGGTMTGAIVLAGDPAQPLNPATKQYTDAADALKLNLTGGTMTGPIVLPGNPAQPLQTTPKQYVDAADAVLQADINTRWNKSSDTIDNTEAWVSTDGKIATTEAADEQFSTIVQPTTPAGSGWPVGKTWLQNDANKTLSVWNGSAWLGVASGGTFTTQPTVIYVDATNGNDADDGHRIINPKKTIKAAVIAANAGDIIKVAPGVYQEVLPIDVTVTNLSIVGEAQRSCFIHPTVATEQQTMFRCNSGTYIDGFTFAGLKASGTRGDHYVDTDATYGLPANQGWVASFYPGCTITKSPYVNNCTNFADSGIDNSNFNPNNHGGTGGDTTSAPTGGGILVDGSVPDVNSPLRSFVINEFTQINLDGPGLLVCNNGYVQAVSFFGIFCHYHAKALSGGQINMEVGTTNFGRYGLIADGKSSTAIFTATANGAASTNATTFAINAPTAAGSWFGDATRPALNMLVQIGASIYPILSATANGAGWNVVISRPNPNNRAENLGLISGHSNGAAVSFFLRSMISTASHTHEYTGAGTSYLAMPENGGVPIEANESVNLNNGRVWLSSVDQNGKFKVGDTFVVDQQTGFVTIDPNSYSTNLVSDLTPELGGDLDVLTRNIYSSTGDIGINDAFSTGANLLLVRESSLATAYPVVTQYDIGTDPNQVPLNGLLGTMAFQDSDGVNLGTASIGRITNASIDLGTAAAPTINFTGDTNTGIYSPGGDQLAIATGGTGRLFVDANGNVGIGATPNSYAGYTTLTINNTTGSELDFEVNGTLTSDIYTDSVGTYWTTRTAVPIVLRTNSVERLRLDSAGKLLVGTSSANSNGGILQLTGGITFPATAIASADPNTLDDYEEGTWTVTDQSGAGLTFTVYSALYTKIGNRVYVTAQFSYPSTADTSEARFSLPFTVLGGNTIFAATIASTTDYFADVGLNNAYASFIGLATAPTNATLSGTLIYINGHYRV
jgi:hypothetical protein